MRLTNRKPARLRLFPIALVACPVALAAQDDAAPAVAWEAAPGTIVVPLAADHRLGLGAAPREPFRTGSGSRT
jgi:hypothetical protein